jgi:signal transduction histidine kinase
VRTLRVQLAVVGFAAIYAPVLLVFGVDLVTEEEVTTIAGTDGVATVSTADGRSPWTVATVILLVPVALALAWWWSGRATRPLDRVRAVADEIGETDLGGRIGLDRGPAEVVALAASFDAMLDRLERAATIQRTLIEETSHELRTPLAVLTTTAEVALAHPDPTPEDHRAALERTRAAATRLGAVVDGLLVEARGRAQLIDRRPVDLVAVVGDVVDEAGVLARGRAVAIAVAAPSPVVVPLDDATVRRAVANLVGNAVRHAPPGSTVEVEVTTVDGGAAVAVTDRGPGLDPEAQELAFARFWRADGPDGPDGAAAGSGLGLPIARQVARAHGGDVTVASPGRAGRGCTFTLTLVGPRTP